MKRDPIPDPTPRQADLVDEFAAWREARGMAPAPDDALMLPQLLARDGRRWLSNFIARWDWSGEDAAREAAALCTPIELACEIVRVIREECGAAEFAEIASGRQPVSHVLHVESVIDQAFALAHRVPVGGRRTPAQHGAEEVLKTKAVRIVLQALKGQCA